MYSEINNTEVMIHFVNPNKKQKKRALITTKNARKNNTTGVEPAPPDQNSLTSLYHIAMASRIHLISRIFILDIRQQRIGALIKRVNSDHLMCN